MCGRYLLTSPPEAVRTAFGYAERPNFPPRYNIAPTQPIAIVRAEAGARLFTLVRWGLLPPWVKDPRAFTVLINARAETIAEKPAFRSAFRRRRCLIPADGWYEWQRGGGAPRPFAILPRDGQVVALAGLHEHYLAPDGSEIETAAIVTVDANAALSGVHDRMPAILDQAAREVWLDPLAEPRDLLPLLKPAADQAFHAVPVSKRVNKVANEGPENLTQDAEAAPSTPPPAPAKRQLDLF
jgi:putative SOS response-associated peptidase YedK